MKKLSIAILGAMLLPMSSAYAEVQPTVEGAQKFLIEVLGSGATRVVGSSIPKMLPESVIRNVKINSVAGKECTTTIVVSYEQKADRESIGFLQHSRNLILPWNQISRISVVYKDWIVINGSIHWTGDKTYSEMHFAADSPEMAERLAKAMNFLREQCDTKKSQYGF